MCVRSAQLSCEENSLEVFLLTFFFYIDHFMSSCSKDDMEFFNSERNSITPVVNFLGLTVWLSLSFSFLSSSFFLPPSPCSVNGQQCHILTSVTITVKCSSVTVNTEGLGFGI